MRDDVEQAERDEAAPDAIFAVDVKAVKPFPKPVTLATAASRSDPHDWPTYNRDLAGTRYSRLTQINTSNVSTLVQAWSYRLRPEPGQAVPAIDKPASSFEMFQQVTPIVVNGVMYLPSGNRVVALEPETGEEIWR